MSKQEMAYQLICALVAVNQELDYKTAEEIVQATIEEVANCLKGESQYKSIEDVVLDYVGLDSRYLWAFLGY